MGVCMCVYRKRKLIYAHLFYKTWKYMHCKYQKISNMIWAIQRHLETTSKKWGRRWKWGKEGDWGEEEIYFVCQIQQQLAYIYNKCTEYSSLNTLLIRTNVGYTLFLKGWQIKTRLMHTCNKSHLLIETCASQVLYAGISRLLEYIYK